MPLFFSYSITQRSDCSGPLPSADYSSQVNVARVDAAKVVRVSISVEETITVDLDVKEEVKKPGK